MPAESYAGAMTHARTTFTRAIARSLFVALSSFVFAALVAGCASSGVGASQASEAVKTKATWAIAIHGGAGTLDKTDDPALLAAYDASLRTALRAGTNVLASGGSAIDACEAVVRELEDNELFNAGKGAAINEQGVAELDAAFMDGSTMQYGTVTGVTTVRNPISLARLLMEKQRYRMLAGTGAEQFADAMAGNMKVQRVQNSYFITTRRRQMLDEVLRERANKRTSHQPQSTEKTDARRLVPSAASAVRFGTVGCVALDSAGKLAAATSTGGLTGKPVGRVGDAPVIGAGTLADGSIAISCTGSGEQFIRYSVAKSVAERMKLAGESVQQASEHVILNVLAKDDGGLVAVDARGNIAMPFSTQGMYRGFARQLANGTMQSGVGIFEEVK